MFVHEYFEMIRDDMAIFARRTLDQHCAFVITVLGDHMTRTTAARFARKRYLV